MSETADFLGPFDLNRYFETNEHFELVSDPRLMFSASRGGGMVSVDFWFQGEPKAYSPLKVRFIGFDAEGRVIVDQQQECFDSRGETIKTGMRFEVMVGCAQPNFRLSRSEMEQLAKVQVAFKRL